MPTYLASDQFKTYVSIDENDSTDPAQARSMERHLRDKGWRDLNADELEALHNQQLRVLRYQELRR